MKRAPDAANSARWSLVLPDAHNRPSGGLQRLSRRRIAGHVPGKLWSPVSGVPLGLGSVSGATVPEASIDKHGNTLSRKDNVWLDPNLTHRNRQILSKPVASRMKKPPNPKLWSRIGPAVRAHGLARRKIDWLRESICVKVIGRA